MLSISQCEKLPSSIIKGILFEYFITLGNIEAYEWVNIQLKSYANKLNQGISEEGYVLWERLLRREFNLEGNELAEWIYSSRESL